MDLNFIENVRAFLFDLDGCIYHGEVLANDSDCLLQLLKDQHVDVGFVTNNSRQSAAEISLKLQRLGLAVAQKQVIAATDYTGDYIREQYGQKNVRVIGSESLSAAVRRAGHQVRALRDPNQVDVVVVGRDTDFTFEKLQIAARDIELGACLVAANPDRFHPGSDGLRVPETGSLVAAVTAVAGREAEYVGKPEVHLFQYGMRMFHVRPEQCVMVGDNPQTDIAGGNRAGMHTIWLTGDHPMAEIDQADKEIQADYVVKDISQLFAELFRYFEQKKSINQVAKT